MSINSKITNGFSRSLSSVLRTLQAYQTAIDAAAIVSITNLKGEIEYVNGNFIKVSKYSADELIGKNHRIINSGHHPSSFFREMWQAISNGNSWRGEIKNRAKDGSYYWVDTVITPVFGQDGNIFQYLSIRNLITAQKENEEQLIRVQREISVREQQLNDAQAVAKTGSWVLTRPGDTLNWSQETYHIFEIPEGTPINYQEFLKMVHPDDRMLVDDAWKKALHTGYYEIEHRILIGQAEKWVNERAYFTFNDDRSIKQAIGTVQDITEKKEIQVILNESVNLYRNLFNNNPLPLAIIDKDSLGFLEVNDTAVRVYGYTREEFQKLNLLDIRVVADHQKLLQQVRENTYCSDRTIHPHRTKDGRILMTQSFVSEIMYQNKKAYLKMVNDVTEQMRTQQELQLAKQSRQLDILKAQENIRAHVGRELHDNINQMLVVANLYLKRLRPQTLQDQIAIEECHHILRTAIEEVRKLSTTLVPPALSLLSLKDEIEELVKNFRFVDTSTEVKIQIDEALLNDELKVNIYRIIQEQCNNIMKYAKAKKVKIQLITTGSVITLVIEDDGVGFDMQKRTWGLGLQNIVYRAEVYNGSAIIKTAPGKGCKISVTIPIPSNS